MVTLGPTGHPFDPLPWSLEEGTQLYRVYKPAPNRHANTFNPGGGPGTRFAFFGDPKVPVLYAGHTEESAVAESLLHDVPKEGGRLSRGDYADRAMARLTVRRELRLVRYMGLGFRRLRASADEITTTEASKYPQTRMWGQAAHAAGFDGIVWMSRQLNEAQAFVFFGDDGRVASEDLEPDPSFARSFAVPDDVDWLTDMCEPLWVDVLR
ncbi:RES family NAD+ phosphorylase [Arthrobacter sp. TMS2-4]